MIDLLKYHKITYQKSFKWVIPCLVWFCFLFFAYARSRALSFVTEIVISAAFLFVTTTFIGYVYMDMEDTMTEFLIILKVKNETYYNLSKIVFLSLISLLFSFIGIIFPILIHVIGGGSLFAEQITLMDIIGGFIVLLISALVGVISGAFFHPRIIKNKTYAILSIFFTIVITFSRNSLIEDFPKSKYFIWIFPPILKILTQFNNLEHFMAKKIGISLLEGLSYSFILLLLHLYILRRNKY